MFAGHWSNWTPSDWVLLISGFAAAVVTIIGAVNRQGARTHEILDKVQSDVATMNSQTIGMLADAQESRRILAIPPGHRTEQERDHLVDLGQDESDL